MTATDLHQRMLHQLDRVKALNAPRGNIPAEGSQTQPHVSQGPGTPDVQPHIPAMNDKPAETEPRQVFSDDDDDRSEARPEVSRQGLVTFAGQDTGARCEITDLTNAGARLRLDDDVTVPSCFELTILPENTAKTAQVCWRDERELGIQFIEKA